MLHLSTQVLLVLHHILLRFRVCLVSHSAIQKVVSTLSVPRALLDARLHSRLPRSLPVVETRRHNPLVQTAMPAVAAQYKKVGHTIDRYHHHTKPTRQQQKSQQCFGKVSRLLIFWQIYSYARVDIGAPNQG